MARLSLLEITDGVDTVSLISDTYGFILKDWTPQSSALKDGGVWRSSAFTDGRRLIHAVRDNAIESFTLGVRAPTQDDVATYLIRLRRLLEKARAYWTTDWLGDPVWMRARGGAESNIRYAMVHDWATPNEDNPFASPFFGCDPLLDDFILVIERGHWLGSAPGSGSCVAITSSQLYTEPGASYNGTDDTYGHEVETCEPTTVYIINNHTIGNISHIYRWDGAAFSGNLITGVEALPYDLLPASPTAGDIIYFGIQSSLPHSRPFSSLVFDLLQGQDGGATIAWEYWNGAWAGISNIQDNTSALSATGVSSFHWSQPLGWVTTAVNGVTGWWVRARVDIGSSTTQPRQQNRNPYAVVGAFIDIDELQIKGDIPALLRVKLHIRSGKSASAPIHSDYILAALRSKSRGADFTPFVNLAQDRNLCWTIAISTRGSFVSTPLSQVGQILRYTPSGVEVSEEPIGSALIKYEQSCIPQYYGAFRIYLRAKQLTGNPGDIGLKLRVGHSGTTFVKETDYVYLDHVGTTTSPPGLYDMGVFTIPLFADLANTELVSQLMIVIIGTNVNVSMSPTCDLYDLILMPIDEWFGQFTFPQYYDANRTPQVFHTIYYHDLDSVKYPKRDIRALTRVFSSDNITVPQLTAITQGPMIVPANSDSRLWFLFQEMWPGGPQRYATHEIAHSVTVEALVRYLGMRGSN